MPDSIILFKGEELNLDTVFGIYIEFKLTQSLNAYLAIVSIFESDANSRVSIVELFSNALFPIILISFGITTFLSVPLYSKSVVPSESVWKIGVSVTIN